MSGPLNVLSKRPAVESLSPGEALGFSEWNRRMICRTFDVTKYLSPSRHDLVVMY